MGESIVTTDQVYPVMLKGRDGSHAVLVRERRTRLKGEQGVYIPFAVASVNLILVE
jgi:hypothetical protein